jgi:ELWxxDGT repeat protein
VTWRALAVVACAVHLTVVVASVTVAAPAPSMSATAPSEADAMCALDDDRQVFLAADDGVHGREPWVSDGTRAGTRLLLDIHPGPARSAPGEGMTLDGIVYFTANDGKHGRALWRTDGTAGGTWLVAEVVPSWIDGGLWRIGHRLVFSVAEEDGRRRPWVSDGTTDGTRRLRGIDLGGADSYSGESGILGVVDDVAYLVGGPPRTAAESNLYLPPPDLIVRTDGTEEGTWPIAEVGAYPPPSAPIKVADRLVFAAAQPGSGSLGLWATDGGIDTASFLGELEVTQWPFESVTGAAGSDELYLAADDGVHGRELWRTDGTAEGTRLVRDIRPGPASSSPDLEVIVDGTLYLTARDDDGRWVWRSDGTEAGTLPLPRPGTGDATRAGLLDVVDDRVIMRVGGGRAVRGTWVTDGTTPVRLQRLPADLELMWFDYGEPTGYLLLLDGGPWRRPLALWRTDGTRAGTRLLAYIGGRAEERHEFLGTSWAVDDRAYFFSESWNGKVHLWTTDGTRAGTREVIALPISARPSWDVPLIDLDEGLLVFGTRDGIWRTDGTVHGTRRLSDLARTVPLVYEAVLTCARAIR